MAGSGVVFGLGSCASWRARVAEALWGRGLHPYRVSFQEGGSIVPPGSVAHPSMGGLGNAGTKQMARGPGSSAQVWGRAGFGYC